MEQDQAASLRKMACANPPRRSDRVEHGGRSGHRRKKGSVRVIAVTSGKGGVGKTHIAANLAFILAGWKKRTMVLDADTGLANIDVILGLTPRHNLYHVLAGERTLRETIVQGPGGMRILPAPSGIQPMAELSTGQKLSLLDLLGVLKDELDYMLIDTAAGIASNVLYFNMAANEIIVVASPEPTSLTDAYAMIKVLYQKHAKKRFLLLVNMVRDETEAKEVFRRFGKVTDHFLHLTIDYLGYIVHDESVPEAVRQQRLLVDRFPSAPASRCLHAVARKLCQDERESDEDGNIRFMGS